MRRRLTILLLALWPLLTVAQPLWAQQSEVSEETLEAVVVRVLSEEAIVDEGGTQLHQQLELRMATGARRGQTIVVESSVFSLSSDIRRFQVGDRVMVSVFQDAEGGEEVYITGYVRRAPLYALFLIFVALSLLVARRRGVASLIGMGLSFFVISRFILPQILTGWDPLLVVIVAASFIIPVNFYLSHGLNRKTTAAILGTLIALTLTGLLAVIFVEAVKLSGYAAEEATFLQVARQGTFNVRGLILAGIVISLLGMLDGVSISQAAIVFQLKRASPTMPVRELYARTMDVGRDHIASIVNTLILVYTGTALPLLLLFTDNARPLGEVINYEVVAEEVVRTLVASIGLILAVPITTLLTCFLAQGETHSMPSGAPATHSHPH